ncbi:3-keto-5-aminohexanoate cleavage protein [Thiothrix subterranea]|uniref:3-keto-5-aminohexanoate cleavage protein n=1 Tax=Thiothrix subterranea TaxID=2735563 RepID=A0AA51MKF6_9GAMM|nr:3-keto-5-aminohexanoate cleavage protein [Thiothrix subterranea]MDQ5770897.1 3-keto-5-aminohexanoate cleavage protein [Thiothrix subterranea]WML85915.1 3-keto-5-aminohexanoate cleavage protein [Thiothrix subterranea]
MKEKSELIINLACTGVIPTKEMTPYIPLTTNEILSDVEQAIKLGVQMVHIHARDEQSKHTSDPEQYGEIISSIRKLPHGKDMIICVTTSGRSDADFAKRTQVIDLEGDRKPDMASLTPGSMNFIGSASINTPVTIRRLAAKMKECGIKPELEVFDLGMANFIHVLAKEKLITPPFYVNILLGNIAGAQVDLIQLGAIFAALPDECIIGVAGLGRTQLISNGLGLLFADAVRVGLEDNIWFDQKRTQLATNTDLLTRIIQQATLFERPLMERTKVRVKLGIEG